ncbi:hypothetical protein AGLY_011499 [Aphis glycines]|uniref:Uncharacterized protein n=1 Tax=Aphis glycines TaxID=307491 RepID=A0A6G0TC37_APHGL|nr:hypothetical protein AGLY_011499 [Aphis glycines]
MSTLTDHLINTISNDAYGFTGVRNEFCPVNRCEYTKFTDTNYHDGIPKMAAFFKILDPILVLIDTLPVWTMKMSRTDEGTLQWQMSYVNSYLQDPMFGEHVTTAEHDCVYYVYGAFHFADEILRTYEDGLIVSLKDTPFTCATFRIITKHFECDYWKPEKPFKQSFGLNRYVEKEHVDHFNCVFEKLMTEKWTIDDTVALHRFEGDGLLKSVFVNNDNNDSRLTKPKYMTGMACCGKTTCLSALRKIGWTFRGRGDLDTFAGKIHSPAQVAGLHAAIDYALRHNNGWLIGDRGPIDNPLWNVIMPLCSPKYKSTVVQEILLFFQQTFNELVVNYHAEFDVVVFLDQYPSRNRKRMLARNTGGDAHRARVPMYCAVQFMAYYIFTVLFGHKIITVPYDQQGRFDADAGTASVHSCTIITGPPNRQTHTNGCWSIASVVWKKI